MSKIIENKHETNIIFFDKKKEEFNHNYIPKSIDSYIGQEELKDRLNVYISSAKSRNSLLDHILLFGPPGLGKTTLASIISKEMNSNLKITSGPILQKSGDLVTILSNLKKNDIFFIDEIHRMPISVEETLYSAMEQFKIDIIIGTGPSAKSVTLPIASFTLIGATTKIGLLSSPLRSRFGIIEKFDWYKDKDIAKIIIQTANFFSINLCLEEALLIAECSRGTPRIAKKIVSRIRDYIIIKKENFVSKEIIEDGLRFFGILENGLTKVDLDILNLIYNRNSALGIEAMAAIIGEEIETIEDVYEPFLLQKGFIERTPRGRVIRQEKKLDVYNILNKYSYLL